jgi:chromosome segregation ATPase
MSLIEEVKKLQDSGMLDKDIAKTLREKGFSPKEVIDAISQSKIKAAVAGDSSNEMQAMNAQMSQPPAYQQYPQEQAYQQQAEYQQYQYPQEQYAYQPAYANTDTIRETAEEVAEEKVAELREQVSALTQARKEYQSAIQDTERRIKQLEASFNQLQMAILGKITDYSKDLKNLTAEMQSTQEAFKKVVSPVVEKAKSKKK